MQTSGSKIGISWAIERFSYLAVPVGNDAVDRERGHRQQVAVAGHQQRRDPLHELRRIIGDGVLAPGGGRHRGRDLDALEGGQRRVDGGEVALHDRPATRAVGLLDRRLDVADRLVGGQHTGQGEEARLHDGVDAVAHLRPRGPRGRRR